MVAAIHIAADLLSGHPVARLSFPHSGSPAGGGRPYYCDPQAIAPFNKSARKGSLQATRFCRAVKGIGESVNDNLLLRQEHVAKYNELNQVAHTAVLIGK